MRPHYITPPPEEALPLFAAPYQRHSETSREAAASLDANALNEMQRRVLAFISRPEGATDEEIATGLAMNPSTVRPRRGELHDLGLIREDGTRKTRSNRNATVWKATAASR